MTDFRVFGRARYINIFIDTSVGSAGEPGTSERRFDSIREVPTGATKKKKGHSLAFIVKKYGLTDDLRYIANLNGIRDTKSKLGRLTVKLPAELYTKRSISVLCGDTPPTVTGGYAKIAVIDRPQRTGVSVFEGFDPITLEIALRFEATESSDSGERQGAEIEEDIRLLEAMAGRGVGLEGIFQGPHGVGRPPLVRISSLGADLQPVPLIPYNYQFRRGINPDGMIYWISGLDWDDSPWRNKSGNRVRQLCTVTLTQFISASIDSLSATERARNR